RLPRSTLFPSRRSSDLRGPRRRQQRLARVACRQERVAGAGEEQRVIQPEQRSRRFATAITEATLILHGAARVERQHPEVVARGRSEEHTSELQSQSNLV